MPPKPDMDRLREQKDYSKLSDAELNEAVAKALGWTDADFKREKQWNHAINLLLNESRPKMRDSWAEAARSIRKEADESGGRLVAPNYSTSIADACKLVDELRPRGIELRTTPRGDQWVCRIGFDVPACESTAPRAICIAFLQTKESPHA